MSEAPPAPPPRVAYNFSKRRVLKEVPCKGPTALIEGRDFAFSPDLTHFPIRWETSVRLDSAVGHRREHRFWSVTDGSTSRPQLLSVGALHAWLTRYCEKHPELRAFADLDGQPKVRKGGVPAPVAPSVPAAVVDLQPHTPSQPPSKKQRFDALPEETRRAKLANLEANDEQICVNCRRR